MQGILGLQGFLSRVQRYITNGAMPRQLHKTLEFTHSRESSQSLGFSARTVHGHPSLQAQTTLAQMVCL